MGQQILPVPLPLRLVAGAALVAWGARTNRPWTLVVAMFMTQALVQVMTPAVLAALPAVLRWEGRALSMRWRPGST